MSSPPGDPSSSAWRARPRARGRTIPFERLRTMSTSAPCPRAWPSVRGDPRAPGGSGVVLGRDVKIYPGAHVVGPALIGQGSIIGHNALVRGSIVGPRCVVGFGSEVARSYLGESVELHHNYAGDSVLDAGSSMGFGAVTANYRLDGRTGPSVT